MKKITLKNLNLKEVEQLSREQLKDVLGGGSLVSSEFSTDCQKKCKSSEGSCVTVECKPGTCSVVNDKFICIPN